MASRKPENAGNPENEPLDYLVLKLLQHTVEVENCRVKGDFRNDNKDNFKLLIDCFNSGIIAETEEEKEAHAQVGANLEQLNQKRQLLVQEWEQMLRKEKQLEQELRSKITGKISSLKWDRKNRREFEILVSFQKAKAMNPEIRRSIVELEKMNTWGPIWKEFLRSLFKW
ncbi:MAG: hypothetical protein HETSPECPRED_004447 [Heterodermia speciosa]|uniref:Uncharacterized protein n=1 Tax=Heterodermia speciosa TaxID=116794 RepID=A0A8H3FHS4_9LECA|nr:MAG: hypothetical protein HETSPECPRED_004447 [Heterodermia speciosa]